MQSKIHMASDIPGIPLNKINDSLLENIAVRHSNFRDPVDFVRHRWGRGSHESVLAALQELQTMWKVNVHTAAPAYEEAVRHAALEDAKAVIDLQWLSEQNKKHLKDAIDRLKPQPLASKPELEPIADVTSYKRMFKSAAHAIALINAALGIDPDDAGGAGPILDAIEKLKATQESSYHCAYPGPPDSQDNNQHSQ